MNKVLFAVFALALTAQSFAQNFSFADRESKIANHFYVNLIGKAATLNGGWGLFGGMRAGYSSNNVSIGFVGHGLIPNRLGGSYVNQEEKNELNFGYGGAEAAYQYDLSDKLNFTGMLMIGAGRADYENLSGYDYFFMMEPGAAINYSLTNWFGLGCSAGYRFASGVNYANLSDASFSGWSTSIDFNFGF